MKLSMMRNMDSEEQTWVGKVPENWGAREDQVKWGRHLEGVGNSSDMLVD